MIRKNQPKKTSGETSKSSVQSQAESPRRTTRRSQAELKEAEYHQRALSQFHPDAVDFFKEKLGIDLSREKTSFLYDLITGKVTEPVDMVVTPLVYDRDSKKNVEAQPLKLVASIKASFPMNNGKMIAPDDDHRIIIQTVPVRPMLDKTDGHDVSEAKAEESTRELPSFSESQLMALEGVGISRERMFGGFNHLSPAEKFDIADGLPFFVDGTVKTDFGYLNVTGEAKLEMSKDGEASVLFQPVYPEGRDASKVLDILSARVIGNLELDIYRRDGRNKIITNVSGMPILNEAGVNLVSYGTSMAPVDGYLHSREYDSKERKFVDKVSKAQYAVSVVNGSLYAVKMKEQDLELSDGRTETVLALPSVRIKEGKALLDGKGEALEFASERDRMDYIAGKGGVVKGATFHDFKTKKDITYDAFVVPDIARGGYGKQFSPSVSKELIAKRDSRKKVTRRQNFGIGF